MQILILILYMHCQYGVPNYDTKLKLLVLAQKCAVRLIDGASYLAHTNDIFIKYGILNIKQLWFHSSACLIYNLINNHYIKNIPIQLNVRQISNLNIYTRTTNTNSLLLPSPNTNTGKCALSFSGPWIWNQIPQNVRNFTEFSTFKKGLKTFTLTLHTIQLL